MAEADWTINMKALTIWATVRQRTSHADQQIPIYRAARLSVIKDPSNSAHGSYFLASISKPVPKRLPVKRTNQRGYRAQINLADQFW